MSDQPSGMRSNNGVIISIGMFCNGEAYEIVQPIATDSTSFDPSSICVDCVQSVVDSIVPDVQAIISSDAYIAFVSGECMLNGAVPARQSFPSTTFPGTAASGAVPTNVSAMCFFYQDPADATLGQRMRIGKANFTGIAHADLVGNTLGSSLVTRMATFALDFQEGFASSSIPSSTYYRVLNAPKIRTSVQDIVRTISHGVRGVTYTQRRRLVPRP
jgi:hypothetical protein